jgi:REP element-mobilizing transposase RayT
MDEYESLSHSKWECKYHIVFIPKGRRRALYVNCGGISVKSSAGRRSRRRVGSRKGI